MTSGNQMTLVCSLLCVWDVFCYLYSFRSRFCSGPLGADVGPMWNRRGADVVVGPRWRRGGAEERREGGFVLRTSVLGLRSSVLVLRF